MEGTASLVPRVLTAEDEARLAKQNGTQVSDYKKMKLEAEARKNWDLFYKRNDTRFFKDRHWTVREFEQLVDAADQKRRILLEVGCGVGNFIFPLIEEVGMFIYACDFSPRAIEFVKKDPRYHEDRVKAFTCDITQDRYEN